jgi:hypothetical protein
MTTFSSGEGGLSLLWARLEGLGSRSNRIRHLSPWGGSVAKFSVKGVNGSSTVQP